MPHGRLMTRVQNCCAVGAMHIEHYEKECCTHEAWLQYLAHLKGASSNGSDGWRPSAELAPKIADWMSANSGASRHASPKPAPSDRHRPGSAAERSAKQGQRSHMVPGSSIGARQPSSKAHQQNK